MPDQQCEFGRAQKRALAALCCAIALGSLSGCGARTSLDLFDANVGAGTAGYGPSGKPCEALDVNIDDVRPAVTLLVDQSGSMRSPYPTRDSPNSRWSLVREALFDPTNGVVTRFELSVRFGITFFTSHNGFSGGACPILSEVSAATHNYATLQTLYNQLEPDDDTPTGAALAAVASELTSASGPQFLILVTDGDPDTCEQPDPQDGQADAVAATSKAFAAGIGVYVVGISNDISGSNLQQLANAGGGKRVDAVWGVDPDAAQPFQASTDLAGLTAQLRGILALIPLCEARFQRDVGLDEAQAGRVVLDGHVLNYGATDGYDLKDSRHLEIVGQACDALKSSGKELSVRISCD